MYVCIYKIKNKILIVEQGHFGASILCAAHHQQMTKRPNCTQKRKKKGLPK